MQISERGLSLIKRYEAFRAAPYKDQAGCWTIGYGHKMVEGDAFAPPLTQAQALEVLKQDIHSVETAITSLVTASLKQNQFDALASLTYNIGVGALRRSTLLRLLNSGATIRAADEFNKWNKVRIEGVLTESPGLSARRAQEKLMYMEK